MQKIFITGSESSGTTLLNILFNYFEETFVFPRQIELTNFFALNNYEEHICNLPVIEGKKILDFAILVGKRHEKAIFSSDCSEARIKQHLDYIYRYPEVKIINIIRDGRDVVYKRPNYYIIQWIRAIDSRNEYKHLIYHELRYEDLVTNPDEEQKKIAKKLNLEILYKFSEYPKYIPDIFFFHNNSMLWKYHKTSIQDKGIGKDYKKIYCDDFREYRDRFYKHLLTLKYIKSGDLYSDKLFPYDYAESILLL